MWLHPKLRIGTVHEAEITDFLTNSVQVPVIDNAVPVHIDDVVTKSTSEVNVGGDRS